MTRASSWSDQAARPPPEPTRSFRPDGEDPIDEVNRSDLQPRDDFLAFSDDGTGDSYGWRVVNGACDGPIVRFRHETGDFAFSHASLADWLQDVAISTG